MKITIGQSELVKALNRIQGITDKKSTTPILSHVLLDTTGDGLQVSATDREIGITSRCNCNIHQEGVVAVASKQLHEITRSLPDREINITLMDNWWMQLQCGRTEYKIVGLNPIDFPRITLDENLPKIPVQAHILQRMIERTIFCTSQDETRQHLRGVYCEWEQDSSILRMAATDGHRLALAEENIEKCPEQPSVIVPRKAFTELRRLLTEVQPDTLINLGFNEKSGQVTLGDTILTITLIEGKFPNYKRVIPTGNEQILKVNRIEFISALKRVSILSKDQENTISLTPREGSATIAAQNPDLGEAHEDLEAVYAGKSFSACFNARYLLDVFNLHNADEIQLEMADEISPTLVKSSDQSNFIAVVMPMRP
jgi:DNA polymerase-3 subunit beta